ncbi:MAG: thiamine pyrophosphate-binding protein [Actinomycetota bacterium]|nr:thiamine pyrophosphate-binding protein [Actinomycetota bacterium]
MTTTAAALAVAVLADAGVRRCYTVPGESFLGLIDAVERHPGVRLVSTRHESGAGFMAEADAKLTGIPALVAATRGPGAANLAVAVHTARQDSTPMIAVLGQVDSSRVGREAFQEVDLAAFHAPLAKWAATATRADRLAELVSQAVRVATTGRPGPAVVAVPADLFDAPVDAGTGPRPGAADPVEPALSTADRDRIAGLLSTAERAVMIAGGGTRAARAPLVGVAERFGVGVYTGFRRQDVFPNSHPLYLGHLGLGAPPETLVALERADVVAVVGCRLSEVTTQGYRLPAPGSVVVQIDVDPAVVGAVVGVAVGAVADAAGALGALAKAAPATPVPRDWESAHRAWQASTEAPTAPAGPGVHPAAAIRAMADALPADAIIANDAGNFSAFLHRYWRYDRPHTQLAPTSGAMGYGVPAAVGAKLARPDRMVVAVVGDGGLLMTGQELETAVRCDAPITVVVFQNGLYGTIAMHQARSVGRTAGVRIGGPLDLAAYARGLGAAGVTVDGAEELPDALADAVGADRATLVDVRTDPDVISPTARLSELLEADREAAR